MLVGAALVALILASPQFVVLRVESELAAGYDFVGIFHSLLQTRWSGGELRIGLCAGDSCHLVLRERIVAPHEIGACQESLGCLF